MVSGSIASLKWLTSRLRLTRGYTTSLWQLIFNVMCKKIFIGFLLSFNVGCCNCQQLKAKVTAQKYLIESMKIYEKHLNEHITWLEIHNKSMN